MQKDVPPFTSYQRQVILLLALTQFTVILDFMVMSPLGDILMKSLDLKPSAFGIAVSAYAFSAGISGFLTAGIADRFDRKKLLLCFYTGFIVGTIGCGLAHSFIVLVAARIITGLFGGVIGAISMAIVTDLFGMEQRGRVMSFLQMGFGASQVLGIPIGLYLANIMGWEAPFLMVAGLALFVAIAIMAKMQPISGHLVLQRNNSAWKHLWLTITKGKYLVGFVTTASLSIGGFMMMPFASAFAINNLKITQNQLPIMFMISGFLSLAVMPIIGRLSDKIDKFKIFIVASCWTMAISVFYTNLSATPFWLVVIFNIMMVVGMLMRMTPSQALISALPEMSDRGAFMSVNSSLQQIAGGIAATISGTIIIQPAKSSPLEHYNIVGYVVAVISALSIAFLYKVNKSIRKESIQKTSLDMETEGVVSTENSSSHESR